MKPSNFTIKPYGSVLSKSEAETVAVNIMVILSRTGDVFRDLTWDEYKSERLNDGGFTESEHAFFDAAIGFCKSEDTARLFSRAWNINC